MFSLREEILGREIYRAESCAVEVANHSPKVVCVKPAWNGAARVVEKKLLMATENRQSSLRNDAERS
jgi:hypothetical protein